MSGIERIAAERKRHIETEGYSPERLYRVLKMENRISWSEPWPHGWRRDVAAYIRKAVATHRYISDAVERGAKVLVEVDGLQREVVFR